MVLVERSSSPIGRALLQASIAAPGNAELGEAVRVVHDQRLASARQRFDSAVEKGEIPPADTYFLTELLSGPVYLYLIRRRRPFTRAVAEKIVDVVLAGIRAEDAPGTHPVAGWLFEDNLTKVVKYIAALVGYSWDELDDGALAAGIPNTDADLPPDTWFEYPVKGTPELTLRIARDHGAGILSMIIDGELDDVVAARFETLLDLH